VAQKTNDPLSVDIKKAKKAQKEPPPRAKRPEVVLNKITQEMSIFKEYETLNNVVKR